MYKSAESIFDLLRTAGKKFHASDWRAEEHENLQSLREDIDRGEIEFAFLYLAAMDGLLHQVGKHSAAVDDKMAWYERELRRVMALATGRYRQCRVFICSDHGMATVERTVDVGARIDALGFVEGRDYHVTYDSTMARIWFDNEVARRAIEDALESLDCGRVLSAEELSRLGCAFADNQFGELVFLVHPGTMIVPSDMGRGAMVGMHGYHPDHPDSDAALLSNVEPPCEASCITDIHRIMRTEACV